MLRVDQLHERNLHKENILMILAIFPASFFLFGVFNIIQQDGQGFWRQIWTILSSPTVLLTDFLEIGGIGPAFINAALIGFINLTLLKWHKMRINGLLIAAFMTVLGFSFFGKNLFNIFPIYIGGFLYCRYQKIAFKDILLVIMFSTSIAPIISQLAFTGILPSPYGVIGGILIGILIGFIIIPLSGHMLRFHDGFNLYNIGFTTGIIGTVLTSILRSLNVEIMPVNILYLRHHPDMLGLLLILFGYLMVIGILVNQEVVRKYPIIFKYRGRLITDFTQQLGYGMTFFNMGLMGVLALLVVIALGGVINGPVLAGIFTIIGFAAFGKQPKNCFPVVLGVILAALLMNYDLSSTALIISVLFSTTIAPLAGTYGSGAGVVAGMLHLALVMNIGVIHGGINLYNNGFSGGLVAGILAPIIDAFKKGER